MTSTATTALELADAIRRGETQAGPSAVWAAADRETTSRPDRIALYGHAMIHAGFLVAKSGGDRPYAACPVCGADLS